MGWESRKPALGAVEVDVEDVTQDVTQELANGAAAALLLAAEIEWIMRA